MFCGKCGKENVDGVVFCIHCGSDLSAQTPAPASRDPETLSGQRTIQAPPRNDRSEDADEVNSLGDLRTVEADRPVPAHEDMSLGDVETLLPGGPLEMIPEGEIIGGRYKVLRLLGAGGMGRFCTGCRSKLTEPCPKCGGETPLGGAFCPHCGDNVTKRRQVLELTEVADKSLVDNRYEKALDLAQAALKLDAEDDNARRVVDTAKRILSEINRLKVEVSRTWQEERYEDVEAPLRRLTELCPGDTDSHVRLLELPQKMRKYRERQIAALLEQAENAMQQEQYTKAIRLAKEALVIVPSHKAARTFLDQAVDRQVGTLLEQAENAEQQEQCTEAIRLAKEALAIVPSHKAVRTFLDQVTAKDTAKEKKHRLAQEDQRWKATERVRTIRLVCLVVALLTVHTAILLLYPGGLSGLFSRITSFIGQLF